MRKLLSVALLALGLDALGCEATYYDEGPPVAYAYVYPPEAVVVEPGVYYHVVVIDGAPHRFYYRWHPYYGWHYHGHMRGR